MTNKPFLSYSLEELIDNEYLDHIATMSHYLPQKHVEPEGKDYFRSCGFGRVVGHERELVDGLGNNRDRKDFYANPKYILAIAVKNLASNRCTKTVWTP